MKVLPGQTKKESDAGGFIKENGDYYIFNVINKKTGKLDHIICGIKSANELIEFANREELELFNPFRSFNNGNQNINQAFTNNTGKHRKVKKWDEEAKELDKAIRWIFMLLNKIDINSPLFDKFQTVNKYFYCRPYDSEIKAVNTIIYKLFNQPLKKKVEDYLGKNISKLKPGALDFSLLKKRYGTIVLNSKKQNKKQIINPQSFE